MFRILRVFDHALPMERDRIAQVQQILELQFPGISDAEVAALPAMLRDPSAFGFRSILFVAEDHARVKGFALLLHFPDLKFTFLDFISAAPQRTGGGIGGALYEAVREASRDLAVDGLFFECLPDDPALCRDPATLRQNAARLRFYEGYGARPIVGTAYETPLSAGGDNPPYLVADFLGHPGTLSATRLREIARAILERKFRGVCPPEYNERVLASIVQNPVRLRPPRHGATEAPAPVRRVGAVGSAVTLVVTGNHEIHHVRERGYVEAPVRIEAILREIEPTGLFVRVPARTFPERHLADVHDPDFVRYLKRVCRNVPPGRSVYPYVFPLRNTARPPRELPIRAGYYCMDTFTPLNREAYRAARGAVDCALTAADAILQGARLAYALVRPPGHHAERRAFGGFCYFNSAAVAAHFLSRHGTVAVLDVDYHHGNGTQTIFWERADVLTVSLHGHPRFAYPYFAGFADERGSGAGQGFNLNLPLPESVDGAAYRGALGKALDRISRFRPSFLVVPLGLDPAAGDPTGTWSLRGPDFRQNGRLIGHLGLPTLVVQEGGYRVRTLGSNARQFFEGLWEASVGPLTPLPGSGDRSRISPRREGSRGSSPAGPRAGRASG